MRGIVRLATCFGYSLRLISLATTFISSTLCVVAPQANVNPDVADRLARGQALAETHCAKCHAVGLTDESPTWVNSNTAFRNLHERFPIPMLEEAARTGKISGHDEMPGFDFNLQDVEALLAYIDSLAPDKPGYVTTSPRP